MYLYIEFQISLSYDPKAKSTYLQNYLPDEVLLSTDRLIGATMVASKSSFADSQFSQHFFFGRGQLASISAVNMIECDK